MRYRTASVIRAACLVATLLAAALSALVFLPAQAEDSLPPGGHTLNEPLPRTTTSRGYLTTPEELQVIAQKAAQNLQPYAFAVSDVIAMANQTWSYPLPSEATCPTADAPAFIDNDYGSRLVWAKALAYHLTGDTRYASDVRSILQDVMTKVLTISPVENQCGLNFGWGTPEFVAAADLIEDYWKDQTCTGPLGTSFGDNRIGSGNCKALFQNWLVKNPYYIVSYWAEKSLNNWGAAATTTIAYIADYLWDRPDLKLVHRTPAQVNGGNPVLLTPGEAYARAKDLAITRVNGFRTDYHGSTSCDFLTGSQQSNQWAPVKSQITAAGIVPDDARREQYCNIPIYNGQYQNYPQIHLSNNIQQCELMLRRGDASCYNNIDSTGIANYSYIGPDSIRHTTTLNPGRGSIERGINAIIHDSGTVWQHDAALAVAYRYYAGSGHSREPYTSEWAPEITELNDCGQDVCYGVLTHALAPGETPTNPPTILPPAGSDLPPTPWPTITPAPTSTAITPTATPYQPPANSLLFAPTGDAYVYANKASANYGLLLELQARAHTKQGTQSYLQFEVTGLTAPVTHAWLRLYASEGSVSAGTISQTANSWTETGVTWANAPAVGAALASGGATASSAWVEFDVTSAVIGNGTVSFALTTPSDDAVSYNSGEAVNNQPVLVVQMETSTTLTPEPPTVTPAPTTETPEPTVATPTETHTPTVTALPTSTPTATDTPEPTVPTDTPAPTETATLTPNATNTLIPTATNTLPPTETETPLPTETPTVIPTVAPTEVPPATTTPIVPPTATPLPLILPVLEPFAAPAWQAVGSWSFYPQGGYSGSAWFADGRTRKTASTLTAFQPIALAGAVQPELRFWERASVADRDTFQVELSTDRVNWVILVQQTSAQWSDWQQQVLDLSAYNGQTIWLRFQYVSAPGTAKSAAPGVWIDELTVAEKPPEAAPLLLPTATVELPTVQPPTIAPPPTLEPPTIIPPTDVPPTEAPTLEPPVEVTPPPDGQ